MGKALTAECPATDEANTKHQAPGLTPDAFNGSLCPVLKSFHLLLKLK